MLINERQAELLLRYDNEIKWQLGVSLGYSSVWGSFVEDENDFIIHEEGHIDDTGDYPAGEVTGVHLIHKEDYEQHRAGILVAAELKEFPLHDEKCELVYRRVLTALEDGSLKPNPTVDREVEGAVITVTKLGAPDSFSVKIKDEHCIQGFHVGPEDPVGSGDTEHTEVIEEMMAELTHLK